MNNVVLKTDSKFALHAPDCALHIESFENDENFVPKTLEIESGAGSDFFTDVEFIQEVVDRFPLEEDEKINWLDLGCAGGRLILDANEHQKTDICIGIDGSVGVYKQESWSSGKNSNILRNADMSKEFSIEYSDGNIVKFDVITCWEVIEHFYESELGQFFDNVYKHLSDDGVFIGSISNFHYITDENGCSPHHPNFNPNGKLYDMHKIFWDEKTWHEYLSKWFVIHPFDFVNKFRNADENLTYYFTVTKKI